MDQIFEVLLITIGSLLVVLIPLFRIWWKNPIEQVAETNQEEESDNSDSNSPVENTSSSLALSSGMNGEGGNGQPYDPEHAEAVGRFYNATTDNFVKVYGEVIQAYRTRNLSNLLNYQIEVMGLSKDMLAIDAGCGVCGPACYFAEHAGVKVEAVTISEVQVEQGKAKIAERGLGDRVNVQQGDYHRLNEIFPAQSADVVYFLESFGHSNDKAQAIDSAWEVLKPGGKLYIKDLFLKEPVLAGHDALMKREVQRINEAYHYKIADLYEVLKHLRQQGWIVAHVKTIDLPLEDFENLSISNEFQELTGIGRIDSWNDYIFPVEFFELVCHKPWVDLEVGNNRYFLQNMYYMQVHGKSEAEVAEMKMNPEDQG